MIKQILTAAVVSCSAIIPGTAFAEVITCEHLGYRVTGRFVSKGNDAELVKQIFGTAFQVDSKTPGELLMQFDDTWYLVEDVRVSRTKNFTLYKWRATGKYTDTNESYKHDYSFRIYNDGRGSAGRQTYPSGKYAYIEAKGKCDNV
jgi:hypothetical protein